MVHILQNMKSMNIKCELCVLKYNVSTTILQFHKCWSWMSKIARNKLKL